MAKKNEGKNPAAVELGRLGGQARVPKGFAMLTREEMKDISRRGVATRKKKAAAKKAKAGKAGAGQRVGTGPTTLKGTKRGGDKT